MINIRNFEDKDILFLFKILSNPLVTEKLPDVDKINSFAEAKRVIRDFIEDTYEKRRFCQAIVEEHTDILIGTLIANKRNRIERSAYVAYELHPLYWGRNLMVESLKRFIPIVQEEFRLKKMKAQTTTNNYRSQKVLKKLGFIKEKEFHYNKPVNGKFIKAFLYKIDLSTENFTYSLHKK